MCLRQDRTCKLGQESFGASIGSVKSIDNVQINADDLFAEFNSADYKQIYNYKVLLCNLVKDR